MRALKQWDDWIEEELKQLAASDLQRELRPVACAAQPLCRRDGKQMLNFSSYNYLGLAGHPQVIQAVAAAAQRGSGATSSRLVSGHDEETELLESELAAWKGMEATLVFSSGYMANLGVLSTFLGRDDVVFSDQLSHASMVDGIRLSGATSYRYRHNEMDHLEKLLQRAAEKGYRRKWIVTESVFSMDGDVAPLGEIVALKERYGAALFIDEAHGSGVFGPAGTGMAHQLGVADRIDLHMGTFSKAFGVYGAYVAGKRRWIRYLVHTCRPFIYTTALPPMVISAIRQSFSLVRAADDLRQVLQQKSASFREQLRAAGFQLAASTTQIIPLLVGPSATALRVSQKLAEQGILAVAIRPPTVPVGKARLRFSLMAPHREQDLQAALQLIIQVGTECGVIA
jgi:8-amino-7-oxononanoate synthase